MRQGWAGAVLLAALCAAASRAQQTAPATRVVSPEVGADRRVTFRLRAPRAGQVDLRGEFASGETLSLQKGQDGVWSRTVGPLAPDLYGYTFLIDGVEAIDPLNPAVRAQYSSSTGSILHVKGDSPALHDLRPVPHGAVTVHWYESAFGETRGVYVYTPPGYAQSAGTRFPTLYLLHGGAGNEGLWTSFGRAHVILDNLIADGRARPMVVVMPLGQVPGEGDRKYMRLEEDLLGRIVPLVERTYRLVDSPKARAIAGLSMGGLQALHIGLKHLDRFGSIGDFSAGAHSPREPDDFADRYAALLADPAGTNRRLDVLWIGCGTADKAAHPASVSLVANLKKHGIRHVWHETAGGHNWLNWRRYLATFAPLLFRS